jgi:hypothetical protein
MRTTSNIALCLLTGFALVALTSPGHGTEPQLQRGVSDKQAILFLPQHFDTVPWLGAKSVPGQKTDFPIGMSTGTVEALRLQAPQAQFSTNRLFEPQHN